MVFVATSFAGEPAAPPVSSSSAAARSDLASFVLTPGFKLELVAAEPMVVAPVAIAFDPDGRLFVAEMRDFSERNLSGQALGRVRLLEGWDDDGSAKTSIIYADHLRWPSALACYGGGLFVAAGPEITFLKDAQGDSAAEINHVVLTGFGGDHALTPSALLNNFNWGLDARIHGVTAGIDGTIIASNWPGNSVSLAGSDFAFDPHSLAVFPESGPASSGLTFDNSGRRYVSDPDQPLRLTLYERRYYLRNPFFARAPELVNVAGASTPVFRLASAPSPGRTNSFAAEWLTEARGCVVYRGAAFPSNYYGNLFLAAPSAHAVHRAVLRESGLGVVAERPKEETGREFLASADPAFRPVQVANGPDGALYVVDMRNGREQGRIYRIVPAGFKRPKLLPLAKAGVRELVTELASANGSQRDTAARLLFERQDPTASLLLSNMVSRSAVTFARLQALHALANQGALREPHVLQALRDPDPAVREHGILLSERLLSNGIVSDALWNQLKPLADDPSLRIRLQLAFTLGEIRRPDKLLTLSRILYRDPANPWIQSAVLSSVPFDADGLLILLANNRTFRNSPVGNAFLRQLAVQIGTQGRLDQVTRAMLFLEKASIEPANAFALLNGLGEGLHRTRSSLALVDGGATLQPIFAQALNVAIDPLDYVEPLRVEAVRLLGHSTYRFPDVADWLVLLCNTPQFPAVPSAAINTLGEFDDPAVLPTLLKVWNVLTPPLRNQAVNVLLGRANRLGLVLDALEQRRLPVADFSEAQLNFLRAYVNPVIRERALKLLGPLPGTRPQVLKQYGSALRLTGSATRGRATFASRCVACHRLGGAGNAFGPDLATARLRGKERLLSDIIEPAAEIAPNFATTVLETKEGQNLLGIASDDNPATVTLSQFGGERAVWPRLNLQSIQPQAWSLMPTGLEQGLSPQDMADLLEFLVNTPQ